MSEDKQMHRYRFNGGEWMYCVWEPIVPADDPEIRELVATIHRDCFAEVCKMGGLPAELLRDEESP